MVALATFLTDDSRTALVGVDALMDASGQARNTFKAARRELEMAGKLVSQQTGTGRGKVTEWTALCLPETARPAGKGVNVANRVNSVDPLLDGKGVNADTERGSTDVPKGGQIRGADQQQPNTLNRIAKPYGLAAAPQLAQDQDQGQGQGQDLRLRRPSTNPQKPRVRQGPGTVADDVPRFPIHDTESTTAGTGTRARPDNPAA